ncbi:MAG: ATP-dependent zinc metalloprotease FtsH [Phycisphaerae bacterium]|nr:ATP-dependent zinc metalloprotease FtsH [Phycisphaerae bacterium]
MSEPTEELKLLIRSRHPLITMETVEEAKAFDLITRTVHAMGLPLFGWSMASGMQRYRPDHQMIGNTQKPREALRFMLAAEYPAVFVFMDLASQLNDAELARLLREGAQGCRTVNRAIILIDPLQQLPAGLKTMAVPLAIALPDAERLEVIVRRTFQELRSIYDVEAVVTRADMEAIVRNLRGLTEDEVTRAISRALLNDGRLDQQDLQLLLEIKQEIIQESGLLEYIVVGEQLRDVGGLQKLRDWLAKRARGFSAEAKAFGIEPPRGILLLGVQGCGKSLMAKVVAAEWRLPLLRLDPSNLYDKYVGESEKRLRDAIRMADSIAPVILWIDEIEKAFASAAAHSTDGGLSQRMFGTLLSWLQERDSAIFVVATSNDVSALPPELLRKGRFDEIFFVDLPDEAARQEIFRVHLQRRKRKPEEFDLSALSLVAKGFSGAEIEQAVVSGLYTAFSTEQQLSTGILMAEMKQTQPLSVTMAERIEWLRDWARGRCVAAN